MSTPNTEYFKFKGLVFYLFLVALAAAVFGPYYFPNCYFVAVVAIISAYLFKSLAMAFGIVTNFGKFRQVLARRTTSRSPEFVGRITHVFVIPSYREDIEILRGTLDFLAGHPLAHSYCVAMALEKREQDAPRKFQQLHQEFRQKFKLFTHSLHEEQLGEAKSKNSNINWCCRHIPPALLSQGVDMDGAYITIIDADSLVPAEYVQQVDEHLSRNWEKRHELLFQPPQIFSRNAGECIVPNRLADALMSYMHMSNLYSSFDLTLGVSNYTLSYRLLERIDFWDTCCYSRTQDMRIVTKSYFKTGGCITTVPIIAPFNQMTICTGRGWWADLEARLTQARRHSTGQIELSYTLASLLRSSKTPRDFYAFYIVFELYACVLFIPIALASLLLQDVLRVMPRSELDDGTFLQMFGVLSSLIFICSFPFYEAIRRKATTALYSMENASIWPSLLLPFVGTLFGILIGFIPLVLSSYTLFSGEELVHLVAPKSAPKQQKLKGGPFPSISLDPESIFLAPCENS